MNANLVLEVNDLRKVFRKPFTGKKVDAVKTVSFSVERGEIFGFLGPNGAGKTTTIKMLTGLIAPSHGSARLLGLKIPSPEAMGRVGFLPENPYVYPYLTPHEFVSLCGRLNGLSGKHLRERVDLCLERVGVAYAAHRPVRNLSKGMLQRVGFAAALVHEPELLILDEPMSGLDPVGRKEIRDLILAERHAGRTVFFSTHILADVELLCDRVTILRKGEVVEAGRLRDLVGTTTLRYELALLDVSEEMKADLKQRHLSLTQQGDTTVLEVEGESLVQDLLREVLPRGARLASMTPKRETLESIFVRKAL